MHQKSQHSRRFLVAIDRDDADAWVSSAEADHGEVLSFAPDATLLLGQAGFQVTEIEDLLTAFSHARIIVEADRMLRQAKVQLEASDLHPVEARAVGIFLSGFVCTILLLKAVLKRLGEGSFSVRVAGKVRECETADAAFDLLAHRLQPSLSRFTSTRYSRLHGRLAQWLNRRLQSFCRHRPTLCHIDYPNPVPRDVARMLRAARSDLIVMNARPPSGNMAETCRRAARAVLSLLLGGSQPVFVFRATTQVLGPEESPENVPALYPSDPRIDRILRRAVAETLPAVRRENAAGAAFGSEFKPDVVILDNLVFPATIRAANEFAARGSRILMINHGTHTLPSDRLSALAQRFWAYQGRISDPIVTDLVAKNPAVAELARELSPVPPRLQTLPIFKTHRRVAETSKPFRIVLAGNFMAVGDYMAWQTETPGEFYRGTIAFAEAIADLQEISLLVKLKARKKGIPVEGLEALFAEPRFQGRVRVDTSSSLGSLYETMDLMVANNSSVIEEALVNHVPVLLNTWRQRYFHMPARFKLPTPKDRGAIYAVRETTALPDMLCAIIAAHAGRPLSEAETAPYMWAKEAFIQPRQLAESLFVGR